MIKRMSAVDVGTVEALSTWLQLALVQKNEVMHLQRSPRSRRSRGRIHHLQAQSEGRRRVNRRPVHERIVGASQHHAEIFDYDGCILNGDWECHWLQRRCHGLTPEPIGSAKTQTQSL